MPTKGICLIWSRGRLFSSLSGQGIGSSAEPSPAGISEPRAEISWCIVMVQCSGRVSRGTTVGCIFLSFSAILILRLASRPFSVVTGCLQFLRKIECFCVRIKGQNYLVLFSFMYSFFSRKHKRESHICRLP